RVFLPLPVAVKILLFLLERVFMLSREQSICSFAPESSRNSISPLTDPATTDKTLVGKGRGFLSFFLFLLALSSLLCKRARQLVLTKNLHLKYYSFVLLLLLGVFCHQTLSPRHT